jgi:hypothetical protein
MSLGRGVLIHATVFPSTTPSQAPGRDFFCRGRIEARSLEPWLLISMRANVRHQQLFGFAVALFHD